MRLFNIFRQKYKQVFRYSGGQMFYEFGNDADYSKFTSDDERVDYMLNNIALMLVLKQNADMFSLVKIDSYKKDGTLDIPDYLHTEFGKANKFQTWEQFLWDYKFWKDYKNAYVYTPEGRKTGKDTQVFVLQPNKLVFTTDLVRSFSSIILTDEEYNEVMNQKIQYIRSNQVSDALDIPLRFIHPFFSLSNGITNNWLEGYSMIDSLIPVLDNSNQVLSAQWTNLKYSGKFIGSKKDDKLDLNELNTGTAIETHEIESRVMADLEFYATKFGFDVKRFVNDIGGLKLDEQFMQQYFLIGKAFGIPKDILESNLKGSTYENQEKSMGRWVAHALQPDIDQLTSFFESHYDINKLKGTWNHLPYMQVFEKQKQELTKLKLENYEKAQQLGAGFTEEELGNMAREAVQ